MGQVKEYGLLKNHVQFAVAGFLWIVFCFSAPRLPERFPDEVEEGHARLWQAPVMGRIHQ
jgi:hypothetical protein